MIKKVKRNSMKNLFINIEKEESWLNDMCKDGYALQEISVGYYVFEACEPGAYIYRLEFLKQEVYQKEKNSYLALMKELNVDLVASFRRWHYFRRETSLGEFEIYTDIDSQIEHYKRINIIWYMLAVIFIASSLFQATSYGNIQPLELLLNMVLLIIGISFLILAYPLTKKIHHLKKKKRPIVL